jgi:hypothetical protein
MPMIIIRPDRLDAGIAHNSNTPTVIGRINRAFTCFTNPAYRVLSFKGVVTANMPMLIQKIDMMYKKTFMLIPSFK